MPSLLTHYLFAKNQYSKSVEVCPFLKGNFDAFSIGNQGADPFFFMSVWPFRRLEINLIDKRIGTLIHKSMIKEFFEMMIKVINTNYVEDKDVLYSYCLGFAGHYFLDRNIHPYVYYQTGFNHKGDLRKPYCYYHAIFEVMIDNDLQIELNQKVTLDEAFQVEKSKLKIISRMLKEVVFNLYGISMHNMSFANSFKNFRTIKKLVQKLPRKVMYKMHMTNNVFYSLINPKKKFKDENYDYLNRRKEMYHDPSTNKENNYSIIEMIQITKNEFEKFSLILFNSYLNNEEELNNDLFSLNYDGVKIGQKKRFYNKNHILYTR